MTLRRFALPLAVASLLASCRYLQAADVPPIEPKGTRVLLLPVLERSGRKDQERDEFIRIGGDTLRAEFESVGFGLAEGDPEAAARELKIDLLDDEQRGKAAYARLAQKLGARLVVAATIKGVASGFKSNLFTVQKAGIAGVQFSVYDAVADRYVVNGNYVGKKEGRAILPGLDKSSTKRTGALTAAFHNGFTEFAREAGISLPRGGK